MKKTPSVLVTASCLLLLASCKSSSTPTTPSPTPSATLAITPSNASLQEGWSRVFEITGQNRGMAPYTWAAEGQNVAPIGDTSSARLTAARTGTFTLTARSSDGLQGSAQLFIGSRIPVAEIRGFSLNVGGGGVLTEVPAQTGPGALNVVVSLNEPSAEVNVGLYSGPSSNRQLVAGLIPAANGHTVTFTYDGSPRAVFISNASPFQVTGTGIQVYFIPAS